MAMIAGPIVMTWLEGSLLAATSLGLVVVGLLVWFIVKILLAITGGLRR